MNESLLVAGVLATATSIVHFYAGERWIIAPISPAGLPRTPAGNGAATKLMLRGISHFWGVSWLAAAAIFFLLSGDSLDGDGKTAVRVLAATFAVYAVVILIAFRGRHLGWAAFAAIAAAAWLGTQ